MQPCCSEYPTDPAMTAGLSGIARCKSELSVTFRYIAGAIRLNGACVHVDDAKTSGPLPQDHGRTAPIQRKIGFDGVALARGTTEARPLLVGLGNGRNDTQGYGFQRVFRCPSARLDQDFLQLFVA